MFQLGTQLTSQLRIFRVSKSASTNGSFFERVVERVLMTETARFVADAPVFHDSL